MARISAGVLKGRTLLMPKSLRPTEGKVRQALFNIIGARIEGARVLDGFAGSGALGLEALSRGAASVFFLEQDPERNDSKCWASLNTGSAVRYLGREAIGAIRVVLQLPSSLSPLGRGLG
jgi:16S rRNA (guanine966-N2)-methyltransferase